MTGNHIKGRGGKRPGAGRKPRSDGPKGRPVSIYMTDTEKAAVKRFLAEGRKAPESVTTVKELWTASAPGTKPDAATSHTFPNGTCTTQYKLDFPEEKGLDVLPESQLMERIIKSHWPQLIDFLSSHHTRLYLLTPLHNLPEKAADRGRAPDYRARLTLLYKNAGTWELISFTRDPMSGTKDTVNRIQIPLAAVAALCRTLRAE